MRLHGWTFKFGMVHALMTPEALEFKGLTAAGAPCHYMVELDANYIAGARHAHYAFLEKSGISTRDALLVGKKRTPTRPRTSIGAW